MPAPPTRFSTITGCFHASFSRCAMLRASRSVEPPAAKGTTTRTSFDGYGASPAETESTGNAHESATAPDMTRPLEVGSRKLIRDATLDWRARLRTLLDEPIEYSIRKRRV